MSEAASKLPPEKTDNAAENVEATVATKKSKSSKASAAPPPEPAAQAARPSETVAIEREDASPGVDGETTQDGANGKSEFAQDAREFMRRSTESLRKGAEEARKGANALIEMSRKISFQTPDWAVDPFRGSKTFTPRADFSMDKGVYEIAVELPGLDEKAVHVKLSDGEITVSGEKTNGVADEDAKTYFVQERQFGTFERSFRVPNDIDPGKIEARFERNVLRITLRKFPEATVPEREIEVKAG